MYNYIAIEGVIGAGKTTYAKFLGDHYGAKVLLEEFEDNPFLAEFYQEKTGFSFPLELSFLASRYHQVENYIKKRDLFQDKIISDFVLYKSLVFASINLEGDELALYRKLFNIMFQQIPVPDLTIYIYHSTKQLIENIEDRGRSYEQNMDPTYLDKLHDNYMNYFKQLSNHRIVIVNGKDLDIIDNEVNQKKLIALVEKEYPIGITYI